MNRFKFVALVIAVLLGASMMIVGQQQPTNQVADFVKGISDDILASPHEDAVLADTYTLIRTFPIWIRHHQQARVGFQPSHRGAMYGLLIEAHSHAQAGNVPEAHVAIRAAFDLPW